MNKILSILFFILIGYAAFFAPILIVNNIITLKANIGTAFVWAGSVFLLQIIFSFIFSFILSIKPIEAFLINLKI